MFDVNAAVANLMAMLDSGAHWRQVQAVLGGYARCQAAMREAQSRGLIKLRATSSGVCEVEILGPESSASA